MASKAVNTLRSDFQYLQEHLRLLNDDINNSCTLVKAIAFGLPDYDDDDVGEVVSEIPVTRYEGEEVLDKTLLHMSTMKLDHKRSGRMMKRLPGIICMHANDPLHLLLRMQKVNQIKEQFKQTVLEISPDVNVRFELMKDAVPDLIKLALYRRILYLDRPAYSVGISWANRHSRKNLTRAEVISMLETTLGYYANRPAESHKASLVEDELKLVARSKSLKFYIKRPLRVAPTYNVKYEKHAESMLVDLERSEPAAIKNAIAHSPIWIFNNQPKIHELESYRKTEKKRRSSTKLPIIERLHLYEQ
tara:strand:+ start:10949 stop:11860 length:912 start_codon:yes stop_codon:yes gene_type:complete